MVVVAIHRKAIAADKVAIAAVVVLVLGTNIVIQDSGFEVAVVLDVSFVRI